MIRPTIIILVGLPGAGKSTYAKEYVENYPNTIHLSSDAIRKELWGDESVQGDNAQVFSLMQSRAVDALNSGKSVVYDATNITRKDRACIINVLPRFVKIEAHVIWAPIKTCIERDAARNKTVGKEVIDKMLKRFQPVYYDENIHEIKIIRPNNFEMASYFDRVMEIIKIPHNNPHHTLNIYDHCIKAACVAYFNEMNDNIKMAALIHDIGKSYVKAFVDSKGNPSDTAHFYSHDNVGAWMAYGCSDTNVVWLVGNHMGPFLNTKYYNNLPIYLKEDIDALHKCDVEAH